jgi:hypothetical protein
VHQVHEPSGDPLLSESTLDDVFEKGRELMDTEATPPWQQMTPPHATTLRQRFAPPRCPPSGPRIASRERQTGPRSDGARRATYLRLRPLRRLDCSLQCRSSSRNDATITEAAHSDATTPAGACIRPVKAIANASCRERSSWPRAPRHHTRRPRCVDVFDRRRVLHAGQRKIAKAARAERHAAERGFGPVRDELGPLGLAPCTGSRCSTRSDARRTVCGGKWQWRAVMRGIPAA